MDSLTPMHVESVAAAFLAGLGTGVHCALMCGPMACALHVKPVGYHVSRVLSYTGAGLLCGAIGQVARTSLSSGPARIAPWMFLIVLLLMALGLDKRLPLPSFLLRKSMQLRLQRHLGWLSVLIPCGPLWLMLGVAASSGSALAGAGLLLSFAMGTVVLYASSQVGWGLIERRVSPPRWGLFQKALLWSATSVLAWRLLNFSPHGCCAL